MLLPSRHRLGGGAATVEYQLSNPQGVQLGEPFRVPPEPFPGCDVCRALSGQWREAMDPRSPAYDPSHASDLAVEVGRHPHPRRMERV